MRYITYATADTYPNVLLVKESAFDEQSIYTNYTQPMTNGGIRNDELVVCSLAYNEHGNAPASFIKKVLAQLLPDLTSIGARYLYCADANYFKTLTKARKAEPHLGYVLPCAIPGYEHLYVVLGINYKSLAYNPANESKLLLSLDAYISLVCGTYQPPGTNIINYSEYPTTLEEIKSILNRLKKYPTLACDIEAGSLHFAKAGIGTISFAWNEHEGTAFACDYKSLPQAQDGKYGYLEDNPACKAMLRDFFETYPGRLKWHGASYDLKVLIYELWMDDLLDIEGMLKGLDIMTRDFDDTLLIAYLATNTTAGNKLSLKDLAHEFAGNWAQDDIKDICRIPLAELLEYNLIDSLATNYTYTKYYPIMVRDKQEVLYLQLMLPSLKVLIQTELTGMPLNPQRVQEAKAILERIQDEQLTRIQQLPVIKTLEKTLTTAAWQADYEARKHKAKNPEKIVPKQPDTFSQVRFNPNSGTHLRVLLYDLLGLPVLDYTDTKLPATGKETLKKLVNHTDDSQISDVLTALCEYSEATKILSTFIPAFETAIDKGDGAIWLHGNFNLGGTKSGRLSSSSPNLQNIPSGSSHGKLIKSCFTAPKGWIFCGADFKSLEDYVSALTTKDPNKLKVYESGYDGHCLRAYTYFKEQMPDIRQATEQERCFKITAGDTVIYCKSGDTVVLPDNTEIPIEELYENQTS